jgi:type II secretory pathway predicted ATPase ExeA
VQTFLLGQTQFRDVLARGALEQLKQRVVASSHLRPLSSEEMRGYVEHRLHTVGWVDNPVLPKEVFSLVYKETGGIPRRINMVFDRLFLLGYVEERHEIGAELVEIVMRELRHEALLPEPAPAEGERSE